MHRRSCADIITLHLYILLLLFMWQQLVTGVAQPGAGLLATVIVQKPLGMRVLQWHKNYKILVLNCTTIRIHTYTCNYSQSFMYILTYEPAILYLHAYLSLLPAISAGHNTPQYYEQLVVCCIARVYKCTVLSVHIMWYAQLTRVCICVI